MIMNKNEISLKIADTIFEQNEEFVLIGLTGRVRAGQDDVVDILTDPRFTHLRATSATGGRHNNDDDRENNIILRFMLRHWRPFVRVHVSSVMMSFLLENIESSEQDILGRFKKACNDVFVGPDEKKENILGNAMDTFCTTLYHMVENRERHTAEDKKVFSDALNEKLNELKKLLTDDVVNNMLKFWKSSFNGSDPAPDALKDPKLLLLCFVVLPSILTHFKTQCGYEKYIVEMQKVGNNLRAYGAPFPPDSKDISSGLESKNIFCIAKRVNSLIKVLRNTKISTEDAAVTEKNKTLVLIDDFKNINEVFYFRKRYSAFYLMSVSTDEESRRRNFDYNESLFQISGLNEAPNIGRKKHEIFINVNISNSLSKAEIIKLDTTDTISLEFKSKCKDAGLTEYEFDFCKQAFEDELRSYSYLNNLHSFFLQDIVPCIENADIFITNNYHKEYSKSQFPKDVGGYQLRLNVMRYVTLMMHPALLTPTSIERCMQLAMAAKLNSGCLSRQVGAVVTDKNYNILSLGWNDSPCGTISCIRRNFFDLVQKFDPEAYSEYELSNKEFREYVDKWEVFNKASLNGIPGAFCFKDVYGKVSGGREQIHTRALHGEERALAVCGTQAKGGYLFTTSSPCELCAKRAKDAGIEKIYFIEQFSGISESHVMQAGQPRAEYEFFSGATGAAYTKLYTPIIPYKDELAARGFNPADNKFQIKEDTQ